MVCCRLSKDWPYHRVWADSPWRWYPSASAGLAIRPGRSLSGAPWSQPPVCRDPRPRHRRSRHRSSYPDPCLPHPREPDHRLPTLRTGQSRSSLIRCLSRYVRKRIVFPGFQKLVFSRLSMRFVRFLVSRLQWDTHVTPLSGSTLRKLLETGTFRVPQFETEARNSTYLNKSILAFRIFFVFFLF